MHMLFLSLFFYLLTIYANDTECKFDHTDISSIDMDDINSLLFKSSFENQKPVIINSQISEWYSNLEFFTIKNLYLNYGNEPFQCGTSTDLSMMSRKKPDEITLKLYLRKKTYNDYQIFDPYFIAKNVDKIGLKSLDLFHKIDSPHITAYTFLMGKIGSGMSFQSHGSIWFHQVTGKTKIYLYPPQYSPIGGALDWAAYTSKQWTKYILPYLTQNIIDIKSPEQKQIWDVNLKKLGYETNITSIYDIFDATKQPLFNPYKPIECVLSEGQLLYIPKLWWYSTLNIKNKQNISMSMIMQTDTTPKAAAIERRFYNDAIRQFKTGFEYLYQYGDANGATQYFIKTLVVDPTFISAYVALADIYIQQAQRNKNKEHLETVKRFLKIAYLLNPDYDTVRESLIGLLEQIGEKELSLKVKYKLPL